MRDKWMNIGYEDNELSPYTEPQLDIDDEDRIRMCGMACASVEIR